MLKITNTDIFGWNAAIRGMRNPMNSWEKSDSYWTHIENPKTLATAPYQFFLGDNDHDLMMRLAESGSDHAKFRRMIHVQMDILAPLYWWKEFDTYKVGTVANSCSTMHKIHAKEFTLEDFSCEHLFASPWEKDEEMPDFESISNEKFKEWNALGDDKFKVPPPVGPEAMEVDWHLENGAYYADESITDDGDTYVDCSYAKDILDHTILAMNRYRSKFLETHDKKYWWQMIQLLPTSYNQLRTVDLNYEVLHNIYHARKNHKLDEWHTFCEWIENLPYSEVITGAKSE